MTRDKFMFALAIFFIVYGLAHINNFAFFINSENRSNGRICVFMETTLNLRKIYYKNSELGQGSIKCPIYHFEK